MKKLTQNDIYALVNSIQPVHYSMKVHQISFQFITDSRFSPKRQLLPKLKQMVKRFKAKADAIQLRYRIGVIHKMDWPEPEPCRQYRIQIWVDKPNIQRKEQKNNGS